LSNKISGIYCIEIIIDGISRKYIGFARNIKARWNGHKSRLRKNQHENPYLQNSWNKYGEEKFRFYIIQELRDDIELLISMEMYFICYYNTYWRDGDGFNLTRGGEGTIGVYYSPERRKQISERQKGEKGPNYGKHLSQEAKDKLSEARKGELSPWWGRCHTEETKIKMSMAQSGSCSHLYGTHWTEEQKLVRSTWWESLSEEDKKCIVDKQTEKRIGSKHKDASSKYLGVSLDPRTNRWYARLRYQGKAIFLGYFENQIEAALAYNEAALEYFGWKAKLNEISEEEIQNLWNQD
jgi:group I intron endonuclease